MARGDVFKQPMIRWLLSQLNMIPIYRQRDGKDSLQLNQASFDKAVDVLGKGGSVLIFVEGFCQHQTTLQLPLKKGAARILHTCWSQQVEVKVLPVWIRYSSFQYFPKTIAVTIGASIGKEVAENQLHAPVKCYSAINNAVAYSINALASATPLPKVSQTPFMRNLLFLPAMLAAILHAPLYLPLLAIIKKATANSVHFDSVLFAVLVFTYPVYVITLAVFMANFAGWPLFLVTVFILPALAACYSNWREVRVR